VIRHESAAERRHLAFTGKSVGLLASCTSRTSHDCGEMIADGANVHEKPIEST